MHRIYLDANGSCPASTPAKEAAQKALSLIGNASSSHEHGRIARAHIDDARIFAAEALGAKAKELIFTSGASEANRLAIDALVLEARKKNGVMRVLMSPLEHPSLHKAVMHSAHEGIFDLKFIEINSDGQLFIDPDILAQSDIVICCQAHNETGIIPDLEQLLVGLSEHTIVMSDVSQAFARLAPVSERVDIMSFSGQKMGAFAGSGGLVLRSRAKGLSAPWPGGGQERGMRPGTESLVLIMALGEAARHAALMRDRHHALAFMRDNFEEIIVSQSAKTKILGAKVPRLANTSALCFAGHDADALRIACDMACLSVGFGSACSGLAPEGSFALAHMGLSLVEQKSTIRFSLTPDAREEEILEAAQRVLSMVLR